jgi:hypothetical protein
MYATSMGPGMNKAAAMVPGLRPFVHACREDAASQEQSKGTTRAGLFPGEPAPSGTLARRFRKQFLYVFLPPIDRLQLSILPEPAFYN